jgi:nucleoside-diphosphate-sugar epimerase
MQTILGAGGAIGIELTHSLKAYTNDIRLVSRNPKSIIGGEELFPADLTNTIQIEAAIKGSEVCYVTIGFDYQTKIWQEKWPSFIKNVVEACIKHQAKLVFFDNIYSIGKDHVKHITENSPMSPSSKKGEIRTWLDNYIVEAIDKRNLEAIIARAPDFFGPVKEKSLLMNLVYDNLKKGKKAQWFCNPQWIHSFGYTPDLAKGTAILGNTPDAYNQIWNLPVDSQEITGLQWVKLFADEMHSTDKIQSLPKWAIKLLGLFVPILRESYEMLYQYDRDYYFDSSKFNNRFSYTPTSNKEAVKEVIKKLG